MRFWAMVELYLNVFLNEKCKDAMNIMDFVDSLKLTLQDLEKTAEVGYVKGITNIIMNGLNQLDVYKRPIHCSDIKRETLYIKDNNAWEKENEEKKKIIRAIRHVSIRNAKQVGEWTKTHKGYNDSSHKNSDKYLKIVSEANGGEPEELNKIIYHTPKYHDFYWLYPYLYSKYLNFTKGKNIFLYGSYLIFSLSVLCFVSAFL